MPGRPLRFLHASDFHLDQPLGGVTEVPEHLRELFIDAPYRAARRVFDAALAEKVDFVVLSGDLLEPESAGPRGMLFLVEQFERLAAQDIHVYWAAGQHDSFERWPTSIRLPECVRLFARPRPEDYTALRDGRPIAFLTGVGNARRHALRAADFWPDKNGLFSIAVVHGEATSDLLADRPIDYWALGSSHSRNTLFTTPHVAHYPGTPQGRLPSEVGPHGATLVVADEDKQVGMTSISTDVVRWQQQRLVVDPSTTRERLEQMLENRAQEISLASGVDLLVSWMITGTGPLIVALRHGRTAADLLTRLRHDFGHRTLSVWSISLVVESPTSLPENWLEQDSLRGEFLRTVRSLESASEAETLATLRLDNYLNEKQRTSELAAAASLDDPQRRGRILRQAALLGADLLSGEDSPS
jgi:DNA repair exonuclease SbcCD nuclease subunit